MTEFEKTIKRELTRDKFREIRDHVYGDGKNTFNCTYGQVASWLTWNRDDKGEIMSVTPPAAELTQRGHYYDGSITNWDQDKLLPVERQFSPRITTDIVFLGLNMSGEPITPWPDWFVFQNARGHPNIVNTFFGTEAEGGYFTDIIKPDRRIFEAHLTLSNSSEVNQFFKAHPEILKDHICLFKKELGFIGAKKPLLIVFGDVAELILNEGTDIVFRTERFHAIVKVKHYAKVMNAEMYKNDTRSKLMPYITFPLENINIKPPRPKKTGSPVSGEKKPHPEPPPLDVATKAVIEGVIQSGITEYRKKSDNKPFIRSMGVGFKTKRMEKYLPQNRGQTYTYWVALVQIRGVYKIRCWVTCYPHNQDEFIVERMNKILSYFDRGTVNKTRTFIDVIVPDCDIADNNPTPAAIIDAVKKVLVVTNTKIDEYFDGIEKTMKKE